MIYFYVEKSNQYFEMPEDRPARTQSGTMGLLRDMVRGEEIEVYSGGAWVRGWVCEHPTRYVFHVEIRSFDDERSVQRTLERSINAYIDVQGFKVIPPSKQCATLPEKEAYVVIAREDRLSGDKKGRYTLATRSIFDTEEAAQNYADSLSHSRDPIVVPGRFGSLKGQAK